MGTKNNPGNFDCYDKAHPDEPMFVLLGRDPRAELLTKLWANLESSDIYDAVQTFNELVQQELYNTNGGDIAHTVAKAEEAVSCAEAMAAWRENLGDM